MDKVPLTEQPRTEMAPSANQSAAGLSADEECKVFVFVLYVVVFGGMCVFGLIGNTLSFLVLQWERRGHVATFLLRVMALVDNFYLVTFGFSSIFTAASTFFGYANNPVQPYVVVVVWPLAYIAQMATVWITVIIALNRYIAICRPFQAPKLCTMAKTRIQLILLGLFIIIYNIPRFLEMKITEDKNNATGEIVKAAYPTPMKENFYYNIIYETVLYCLFIFLGPLVILIFFNVCLVLELMAARKRLRNRYLPVSGEEEENNLTLVMIIIILMFLICQTPAFLNQFLHILLSNNYLCGNPYYYFFNISNLLASANSCLNFVIYCAFRKQFRSRLRRFCQCRGNSRSLDYAEQYNNCDGETVTMYVSDTSDKTKTEKVHATNGKSHQNKKSKGTI